MPISGKTLRDAERVIHLIAGVGLLLIAFTPLGDGAPGSFLRFLIAPLLIGSGILMWQHARVMRSLRARDARAPIRGQ